MSVPSDRMMEIVKSVESFSKTTEEKMLEALQGKYREDVEYLLPYTWNILPFVDEHMDASYKFLKTVDEYEKIMKMKVFESKGAFYASEKPHSVMSDPEEVVDKSPFDCFTVVDGNLFYSNPFYKKLNKNEQI